MKKKLSSELENIQGGGPVCDFATGAIAGWGISGLIVGGIAATGGMALALGGLALSLYCAGKNAV
ncbi:hypothetical protein [Flectobacillus rivi]|uniref:Bacteriocin n=1 Tax=Flectobacillus rivi TaxID=2984209 RepID=A0ABT6Z539_9BACT|nr:hypothetical protein [Flectobacillus rivi]MDI9876237.1 hypothetical protein [Flectobacillus rivi]